MSRAAKTTGLWLLTLGVCLGQSDPIPALDILVGALPPAIQNVPYSAAIPVSGGVGPYTFSLTSGSLPVGLSLNSVTGAITGAPTGGTSTFVVNVRDSSTPAKTSSRSFTIAVQTLLRLVASPLADATVGIAYSATVRASGGVAPYIFTLLGGGSGFQLAASGALTGSPAVAQRVTLTVRVTDSGSPAQSVVSDLPVNVNAAPAIRPLAIPDGVLGRPYSQTFIVEGGTNPSSPAPTAGAAFPPGVSFSNGRLSGTPTQAGSFAFALRSTDSNGAVATQSYTLRIGPGMQISTGSPLPEGVVGSPYSARFDVTGAAPPVRWTLSGALPPGVAFSAAQNYIGGTPTSEGTFNFTVTATDSAGAPSTASKAFTLRINGILSIVTPGPLPTGTVGQAYRAAFSAVGGVRPYTWSVAQGSLPPGFSLSATGELSGTPAAMGTFGFAVQATDASGRTARRVYAVVVQRAPSDPVVTELIGDFFEFTAVEGSPPQTRSMGVFTSNPGESAFETQLVYGGGASGWLTLTPARVTVRDGVPGYFTLQASAGRLAPGTYNASVRVIGPGIANLEAGVRLVVSRATKLVVPTPVGLTFSSAEATPAPPSQRVNVLNAGLGALNWDVSASTLSGPPGWITVSPQSGTSDAGAPSGFGVSVNPAGLTPGTYYGQVRLASPDALNSPQTMTVVYRVRAAGEPSDVLIQPAGLVLNGTESQEVRLIHTGRDPVDFFTSRFTHDGASWFAAEPSHGTLTPGIATTLRIRPSPAGLSAGVRRGTLSFSFSTGGTASVDLALVLGSAVPSSAEPSASERVLALNSCNPTQLVPVSTLFGSGFNVPAGWPTPVEVRVVDDCGTPMTSGSVVVSFSNGDVPLNLVAIGNGRWSGTWTGRNALTPQVTVTVTADNPATRLRGVYQTTGGVQANADPPIVASGGIVNAASYARREPLAPGMLISIFGSKLATTPVVAQSVPLDTTLGVTTVTLGGRPLPLSYAADGQVNAMVPYGVPLDTPQGLLIRRGTSLSVPEQVIVTSAQPGVFTRDASGKGNGVVYDAFFRFIDAANPAKPGDVVTLLGTGVGSVTPAVEAGMPAPDSPLSLADGQVTATVGGVPAEVTYAGLAPRLLSGVAQLNVRIPTGVTPGDQVQLTVSVAGRPSQTITIAVRAN